MEIKDPTEEQLQEAVEICNRLPKQIKVTAPTGLRYPMKQWQEDRKRLEEE